MSNRVIAGVAMFLLIGSLTLSYSPEPVRAGYIVPVSNRTGGEPNTVQPFAETFPFINIVSGGVGTPIEVKNFGGVIYKTNDKGVIGGMSTLFFINETGKMITDYQFKAQKDQAENIVGFGHSLFADAIGNKTTLDFVTALPDKPGIKPGGKFLIGGSRWTPNTPILFTPSTTAATGNPEPSTFTLLGLGSLGLMVYCWRRRKRVAS
jgi:hypothetical protein